MGDLIEIMLHEEQFERDRIIELGKREMKLGERRKPKSYLWILEGFSVQEMEQKYSLLLTELFFAL